MENKKRTPAKLNNAIGPNDGYARSPKDKAVIAAAAKKHHENRSAERLLRNEMLAIRYQMETYILEQTTTVKEMRTIRDFANEFLRILNLKKGDFAFHIEIDLANLNKYYNEDRKFNPELALKFGHFFHTPAELWLRVQFKNDMMRFEQETKAAKKYEKYDYEKVLGIA
jgi:plasmid maintenance system antidote protein VapI